MTATQLSLAGRSSVPDSLAVFAELLSENPGRRLMGICEFAVDEVTEPRPDKQKDKRIKLEVVSVEIGRGDQEHILRSGQQALHIHRTAGGTLGADDDIKHAEATLEKLDKHLDSAEAARMVTAYDWLFDRVSGLARSSRLDTGDLLRELKKTVAVAKKLKTQQLKLDNATAAEAAFIAAEREVAEEEAAAAAELAEQTEKLRAVPDVDEDVDEDDNDQ